MKLQRRKGVARQLAALAAFVVGVPDDAALVIPFDEHHAGAGPQVTAHGGHRHGVGFGHLGADGFLEPLVKLLQRGRVRGVFVEFGAFGAGRGAGELQQARQRLVVDAHLAQPVQGVARIVMCAAIAAAGLLEDAAVFIGLQLAGVAGAAARERKRQRLHGPLRRVACQPARVVHGHGHFALPQVHHDLVGMLLWNTEHHAPAAAAREHAEYQARALGRAPVDVAPHLERAVPAVHARVAPLGVVELGAPDERGIAKNPQIALAAPFLQGSFEQGRRVARGGRKFGHADSTIAGYPLGSVCDVWEIVNRLLFHPIFPEFQ